MLPDDEERGVTVSMGAGDDAKNFPYAVEIEPGRVTIEGTRGPKYVLDVSRVDAAELSEMKALLHRMNFDRRFEIKGGRWARRRSPVAPAAARLGIVQSTAAAP
jgi:hypothetical protein